MFEYYVDIVPMPRLHIVLNDAGALGWRLHTCEFRSESLRPGSMPEVVAYIVMDRVGQSAPKAFDNNEPLTAMAMK